MVDWGAESTEVTIFQHGGGWGWGSFPLSFDLKSAISRQDGVGVELLLDSLSLLIEHGFVQFVNG